MNKYNAKKTVYDGITYDSRAEASFASQLNVMRKASGKDRVTHIERQPVFSIELNGHKICKYIADFRVTYIDGTVKVYDVKGMITPVYRLKKKLVEAEFGIKIIEVNQNKTNVIHIETKHAPYWALTEKDYESAEEIKTGV